MGDEDGLEAFPRRPLVHLLGETTIVLVLFTFGYYLLPLRLDWDHPAFIPRLLLALVAFGALGLAIRAQARRSRRSQAAEYYRIQRLLSALYVLVLGFAFLYSLGDRIDSGAFVGVTSQTSALYFSLTIVSTVGLGEVHPTDTFGQVLVSGQMLFDVIFIGTAARVLGQTKLSPAPKDGP